VPKLDSEVDGWPQSEALAHTVFSSWLALAVSAALFLPLVVRRILLEEPMLLQLDGYADYAKRRKRLLPLLW
jgi:protein-S-isoprenylcysteine O-methyltransferase Ste14